MTIIKEYRSRWEYLRGTQDNKKGISIPVRVGPDTYFVGPSAELNAGFHVMKNIAMAGQSREPGAGPTGSAWVTSQEASPGRGDKCRESPGGGLNSQCTDPPSARWQRGRPCLTEDGPVPPPDQEQTCCLPPAGQQELLLPREGGWKAGLYLQ